MSRTEESYLRKSGRSGNIVSVATLQKDVYIHINLELKWDSFKFEKDSPWMQIIKLIPENLTDKAETHYEIH